MQNNSTWAPLPPSPIGWPRDSFRVTLTIVSVIGAMLVVFGAGIAAVVVAMATGQVSIGDLQSRPPRLSADFQLWSQFAIYAPVAAYLWFVVPAVSKLSLHDLGLRAPTGRDVLVGAIGMVAMFIGVSGSGAIIEALTHIHDTEAAIQLLKAVTTPVQRFEFILMAVVIAPLVEEFAFRVFLFNAFRRWMPFWPAAVASGFLFGLAHAQSPSQVISVAIPLTFGGIVLAFVYDRTRCYWSNVLTHALFNCLSVVAVFGFHVKP